MNTARRDAQDRREPWSFHTFRDRRGRHPVEEFLDGQSSKDRKAVRRGVRVVRELTRYQRPETIGLPYVKVLESPIWEMRPTTQIRLLTAWIHEERLALLLEADRKKNGRVDAAVVERAKRNLAEWHVTRSSDLLEGL